MKKISCRNILVLTIAVLMLLSFTSCEESENIAGFTDKLINAAGHTIDEIGEKFGEEIGEVGNGGVYSFKNTKEWNGEQYTVYLNAVPQEMEVKINGEKKLVPAGTAVNFMYECISPNPSDTNIDNLAKLMDDLSSAYGKPYGFEEFSVGDMETAEKTDDLAAFIKDGKSAVLMQNWHTKSAYDVQLNAQFDASSGSLNVRIDIREPFNPDNIN